MVNKLRTQNYREEQKTNHSHVPSDGESGDEKWLLGFNEKGGDAFLKDVRAAVEDIGNQHENVEFGFRIK